MRQWPCLNILPYIRKTSSWLGYVHIKSPESKHSTQWQSISYKCLTFSTLTKQTIQWVCTFTPATTSHYCVRTSTGSYNMDSAVSFHVESGDGVVVMCHCLLVWPQIYCDKHRAAWQTEDSRDDVNRGAGCLWKRAQSHRAACLLNASQHDLISGAPKHWHKQTKTDKQVRNNKSQNQQNLMILNDTRVSAVVWRKKL